MLYAFFISFVSEISFFNVFRYITFRTLGATMTAFFFIFFFGPLLISVLRIKQGKGQPIREDGPQRHLLEKQGTPTMGGLLIISGLVVSTLLWGDLRNLYVWAILFVTLGFGAIGFYDDYLKVSQGKASGFSGRLRLLAEVFIALCITLIYVKITAQNIPLGLTIPFLKGVFIHLGLFFIPFAAFVIVGSANAVNLTDGLDGLAIVPVMIAGASFGFIAYLVGSTSFSSYLHLIYVRGAGELSVFCGALIGAGLGFLWFNAPPAMIFMGDTGALSLGGALGAIAVMVKHEVVWMVIGGVFVLETVSVIVQVISFKLTGRRVFAMAPLHHHFEQKGWAESTIVIRFWIISVILALIGLATLKLR